MKSQNISNMKANTRICGMGKSTIIFLFSLLISTSFLSAQTAITSKIKKDVKVESDDLNKKVNIEFGTENEVYNLLVLITDSSGQTVFLDNRYHFKGDYKHTVDFKDYHKGEYSVKIIGDEEKIDKKIDVK
jgi:hypothetical protein